MPIHINDSATWRQVVAPHINDGGTWRECRAVWINDGGTWRIVHAPVQLAGTQASHTNTRIGATCFAGVSLNATGDEYSYSNTGSPTGTLLQSWLLTGAAADYYVFCDLISGTLIGGSSATGSWIQLNVTRNWAIDDTTTGDGPDTATLQIQIAGGAGGTPVYVGPITYNLSAEQDV